MERISKSLVAGGLARNDITFRMEDGFLAACIGGYWFFISSEYGRTEADFTADELVQLVYEAVNSEPINNDKEALATECLYYKAVLEGR